MSENISSAVIGRSVRSSVKANVDKRPSSNRPKPTRRPKQPTSERSNVVLRECFICCSKLKLEKYPEVGSSCDHASKICTECMNKYLETQIDFMGNLLIQCPVDSSFLSLGDVKLFARRPLFDRYDDLLFKQFIQNTANFRWCKAPECGSGQIHENSSGPQMVCHECGFEICFTHDVPWHQDLTCEQYDATRSPSRATKNYLRRNTKQCPGCTFHIEKIDGCNHMICSECQCNFCWSCSGQEGHHTSACEDHHYDDDDVSGSDNDVELGSDNDVELGSDNDVDNFSWIDRFGSGRDSA